jgi:hypothetical protein
MKAITEVQERVQPRRGIFARLLSIVWQAVEAGLYVDLDGDSLQDGPGAQIDESELDRALRQAEMDQNFRQKRREEDMGPFAFPPSYFDTAARG